MLTGLVLAAGSAEAACALGPDDGTIAPDGNSISFTSVPLFAISDRSQEYSNCLSRQICVIVSP